MPNYTPSLVWRTQNPTLRLLNTILIFATALYIEFSFNLVPINMPVTNLMNASIVATGIQVIIAFIIALIAALIGVSLISPVATTVGGALKNGNLTGAANSVTAQITLIFVTLVILGILVFLAMLGHFASKEAE